MFLLAQGAVCALPLLAPALLIGFVFPLAVHSLTRVASEAGVVGRLYALNVLGALAGVFAGSVVLLPRYGMQRSLLVGVMLNFLLAAVVAIAMSGWRWRYRIPAAALALTFMIPAALTTPPWDPQWMTAGPYLYAGNILRAGTDDYRSALAKATLLLYKEGVISTVAVQELKGIRVLTVDGRIEGGNAHPAQVILGHFPFVLDRPLRRVFMIGLGTGNTAGAATLHRVERIDVAEREPAILEAGRLFSEINRNILERSGVRIMVADPRHELEISPPAAYDAILSRSSSPWVPAAANLFTSEFYRMARKHLAPGGVFVQWVQLYNLEFRGLCAVLKSFQQTFPQTFVIEASDLPGDILLLGGVERPAFHFDAASRLFSTSEVARDLARANLNNCGALLARILFGPAELAGLARDAVANTDDNGLLEFSSARMLHQDTAGRNLRLLRERASDPLPFVVGLPTGRERQRLLIDMASAVALWDPERALNYAAEAVKLAATLEAYRTLGDRLYGRARSEEAVQAWRRCLQFDPNDPPTLQRLVRYYGMLPEDRRPREYHQWFSRMPLSARLAEAPPPLVQLPRVRP